MKTNGVATLNARKFKAVFLGEINLSTILLISLLFLITSCDKSDDLEPIRNESPIDNESPPNNEPPPDNDWPTNDQSNIVYTDIEPDFTSINLNDYYNLDLNNDQIIEFTLSSRYDSWMEWFGIASNPNFKNSIISTTPWYSHPVPLNSGKEIFNLRGYSKGESFETWGFFIIGDCFANEKECLNDWKNKGDMYLGLRFNLQGKIHYGWARMNVASTTKWVIKDYAYNATPNNPILAGQKDK
ncbi:MAG: hypothetical protein ABJ092_02050 [Gillisia sp.]